MSLKKNRTELQNLCQSLLERRAAELGVHPSSISPFSTLLEISLDKTGISARLRIEAARRLMPYLYSQRAQQVDVTSGGEQLKGGTVQNLILVQELAALNPQRRLELARMLNAAPESEPEAEQ